MTTVDTVLAHEAQRAAGGDRLGRQFGLTALANLSIAAVNLMTGLGLARLLGANDRGLLAAVVNWPMILATFGTIGLTEACAYYTSRRRSGAHEYYLLTISISAVASSLLAGIGWLLMPLLLSSQSAETVTASRWLLLICPFATIVTVSEGCLRGLRHVPLWNAYRVAWPLAWLVVIVTATVTGQSSPYVLALGFALTRAVAAIPVVIVLLRRLPGPRERHVATARALVRYGAPGFLTLLPQIMSSRLDQLLLAGLVDAETLGLYVVSVAWSVIAAMPAWALAGLVLPRLAAIPDAGLRRERYAQASRLGALMAVCSAAALLAVTPIMLPLLFGNDFRQAVPAAMVLVVASAVGSWNVVMEDGARGLGSPATVLKAEAVGLLVSVAMLFALLGPLSILGAAIASVVGYSSTSVMLLLFARRETHSTTGGLLLPRRSDLGQVSLDTLRQRVRAIRGRSGGPGEEAAGEAGADPEGEDVDAGPGPSGGR